MGEPQRVSGARRWIERLPLRSTGREEDSRRQYILMGIFVAVCVVLGIVIDAMAG